MNVKDRIKKFIEYQNLTVSRFEKSINASNGYINSIAKSIGLDKIENILEIYPNLNIEWLLTGNGQMLKNEANEYSEAIPVTDKNVIQIPLVSQYAYAGYLGGFDDPQYIEALPTVPIFVDRELKGNYLGFEVRGDSMEDGTNNSIIEGDILISREVKQMYWKYKLHINKWNYVIVHRTEGILVKRIIEHNVEKCTINIHSLNPLYEDLELSLNDVAQLFNVVQVVRKMKI